MSANVRIALLIGSSLLLSGCQLFQGRTARLEAGLRIPRQAEPREYARQQFELGRSALESRSYVAAITAFRNSALEPDFAAASYNGLGIAYAGIGRNDLAGRYFRTAVALDPASPRYAANLARLDQASSEARLARLERDKVLAAPAASPQPRLIPGTRTRASLEVASPHARFTQSAATPIRVGMVQPAPARPARPVDEPRQAPKHAARPVAIEGPRAASLTKAAGEDHPAQPALSLPKQAPAPAVAAATSAPRTVSVPGQWTTAPQKAPAITTTGRRYSPAQFAEIFEPYAQPEARTPIMASVTSPGLRSNAPPQPVFGHAATPVPAESLALAGQ